MGRFSSLEYAPAATRQTLRDRFTRYLASDKTVSTPNPRDIILSDESLLHLLQNIAIDFASEVRNARAIYTSALSPDAKEPTFDELIDAGWINVVWGRVSTSYELVRSAEANKKLSALVVLLKKRFDETYRIIGKHRGNPDLDTVAEEIRNVEIRLDRIGCQTPAWVAARLWECMLSDSNDRSNALRVWFDLWEKLGHPSLVPGRVWDEETSTAFRVAAFAVLKSDPGIPGWEAVRTDLIKKQSLVTKQDPDSVSARVPCVPEILVDRVSWIFDCTDHSRMREYEDVEGLVSLLLADVEAEHSGPAPHPVARRLIDLAKERADLFFFLVFHASHNAAFLVDLLLSPSTSGVACLLIARWRLSWGGLDRDLIERDNKSTKAIAFADAASVFSYFLARGEVDPKEAASLVDCLHGNTPVGIADDTVSGESMLSTLRDELAHQPREILRTMVAALSTSPDSGLGTSKFAAALDIVDSGGLSDDVDPVPLVDAYVQSIIGAAPRLTARSVRISEAVSLLELASRAPSEMFRRFLCPVDVKERLAGCSPDEWYTFALELSYPLRVHIRVLSRAVAGIGDSVQEEVVAALIAAIRAGALEHQEKGRIPAFAPNYEAGLGSDGLDRSIGADIGGAIGALGGDKRERVLSAVLETDEPMVLAQLVELSPYATRERIKRRIEELPPSEAGNVHSLTDVQARIEALLSAGLADAAERFIETETQLNTLGRVAGRKVERLRAGLRLHWLRGQWEEIANVAPPSELSQAERQSAVEVISYFKAIAGVSDPDGDSASAEAVLARLQRERPDVPAYVLNLFAARLAILLEDDSFRLLEGMKLIRGRQVLRESEEMMRNVRGLTSAGREVLVCNKALLLLALGQAEQANELLAPLRDASLRDTAAAYSAVALARLQRESEAKAVLESAARMVGDTEVLRGARAHIENSTSYAVVVGFVSDDGVVARVKSAFADLRGMDHVWQGRVLEPSGSVEEFVISQVRSAATSLIELVPMMRSVEIDSCEDDLNGLIRELLTQRVEQFLGWSVSDQSKGGFTASENPGERDAIIKRGSATIAVAEAMVWGHGRRGYRRNLCCHFHRLLAYGTCEMFFLIVYSYADIPGRVLQTMDEVARNDAPQGFEYHRSRRIEHTDSRPPGFIAYYHGVWGKIKVVFLVLDMWQGAQRSAVAKKR